MAKSKEEQLEYQRQYRAKNKAKIQKQSRESWRRRYYADDGNSVKVAEQSKSRRQAMRAFIERKKHHAGCSICGEMDPACLDYHHIDERIKNSSISLMCKRGNTLEKISEEMKKCIILCSNCHRKKHYRYCHAYNLPDKIAPKTSKDMLAIQEIRAVLASVGM